MAGERVLIVDDEKSMCQFLSIMLRKEGYRVTTVNNGKKAIEEIRNSRYDVVLTDIKMSGMDGIEVLTQIKNLDPSIPVIIMTAYASQKTAIEAVNKGAFHYLIKHAKNDEIKMVIRNALDMKRVRQENLLLRKQLKKSSDFKTIIGKSEEMDKIFKLVDKVADSDSTIMLYGESGTGKELIARAIHYRSNRVAGPFVSINCGALPESLLESELFGHVKGSFTGAIKDKEGLFKVAQGGTFFLDEVGETSPTIQVKLLRVLQEREIIPVGGTNPIRVEVRLVAATNADLEKAVKQDKFRADLFYRLNVIPIHLPSLRKRKDDIPLLVNHFLRKFNENLSPKDQKVITKQAMEVLVNYSWPGNVRELENVIERAVILAESQEIGVEEIPDKLRQREQSGQHLIMDKAQVTLEELEKEYLIKVLNDSNWQKKKASAILGINASTLYRKIQRYGLEKEREKQEVE
ncbi:MAG: response regulator [Candidatus Latescibacteria bacterium]|nr:response regulator [Candidatus Latescibacterota bacterium]NIM21006.1 response regulator [Candidatus Latescibacterota bacterium]NIM65141.1 response regulator [Candidatus Latescibacterota bacterium]NIO01656.1 response regulator [Candidatus Latescibacterota bacterium]NIO28173.1 response regulator [Candidatus Latescibacterota bacterium]